ncbi:MAG TPA: hypothetical protein DE036_10770 [Actinobacteria bacterium]|nr:hypothetical protein [Actinomycetota bacterium]
MTARLRLYRKSAFTSPSIIFMLIAGALFLALLLPGTASATISVASEQVKRGSATPGMDNIVMQRLVLKTDAGTAQWTSIKLSEFGTSDATPTIESVKIYKETNGVGDIQFSGTADTSITAAPVTFSTEETVFTFSAAQTLSETPQTFYIVYHINPLANTSGGQTVGSRLADESYIIADSTVEAFTNLQSREITLASTPHATGANPSPFASTTNLCQTCHAVHLAPDFGPEFNLTGSDRTRRILKQPYFESPSVVNYYPSDTYNALCLSCHDGTGSFVDIKSKYNSTNPDIEYPGHQTSHESTHTVGYKPPNAEPFKYFSGTKMPCMACHDIHTSNRRSHKMLSDKLYEYAVGQGWEDPNANGRIDAENDEICLVCHRRSDETSRTVSIVFGYELTLLSKPEHDEGISACTDASCHGDPHELNINQ